MMVQPSSSYVSLASCMLKISDLVLSLSHVFAVFVIFLAGFHQLKILKPYLAISSVSKLETMELNLNKRKNLKSENNSSSEVFASPSFSSLYATSSKRGLDSMLPL